MKYMKMEYSYNLYNSKDHQLYLQGSSLPGTYLCLGPIIQPIPHRTPVALFWDLFRGLHLTSWRWMACRRINYPHDLLGVSETLQPDYPRLQLITAGAPLVRCQNIYNYLQLLWTLTFNHRGPSLLKNARILVGLLSSNLWASPFKPICSSTWFAVWWGIST